MQAGGLDARPNLLPRNGDPTYHGEADYVYFTGATNPREGFSVQVTVTAAIEVIPAKWTCLTDLAQLNGTSVTAGASTVGLDIRWETDDSGFVSMMVAGNEFEAVATPGDHHFSTDEMPMWYWQWYSTEFEEGASIHIQNLVTNAEAPIALVATHGMEMEDTQFLWHRGGIWYGDAWMFDPPATIDRTRAAARNSQKPLL